MNNPMNFFSYLKSFRGQLFFGLGATVLVMLSFEFYTFLVASELKAVTTKDQLNPADITVIQTAIDNLARSSFYFLALTFLIVSGILIYLILNLTSSLHAILKGIQSIQEGHLSYRIRLNSNNEFGQIAKFFNRAASSVERIVDERTNQLEAERNKMAVVLSGITDGIVALDLQRNIITFNKNLELLTGYKAEEVLGKPISEIFSFAHNDKELSGEVYAPVLRENFEGVVFQMQGVVLKTPKTDQKTVNIITSQIRDGGKVKLGCILTLHDVSREKQLEEMKLDFVSMAAHELRTPLTAIRGYAELLQEGLRTQLPEEHQQLLERLIISTENLAGLIENLLNVSRIERGKFKVESTPLPITPLIQETITNLQSQALVKKQTLLFSAPTSPQSFVLADKFRIYQVLINLISNALTYTPVGGTITVSIEEKGAQMEISVRDNGIGIPKEAIPNLFTKFFRVSGPLEEGSKGTGLGLYISKSIVELHKGTIRVESVLGHGSTFIFTLPIATQKDISDHGKKLDKSINPYSQPKPRVILNKESFEKRFGKLVHELI